MKCFSDRDPGSETGSEAAHLEDLNLLAFSALSRSFSEVCMMKNEGTMDRVKSLGNNHPSAIPLHATHST
jgi:hypothetical protein